MDTSKSTVAQNDTQNMTPKVMAADTDCVEFTQIMRFLVTPFIIRRKKDWILLSQH